MLRPRFTEPILHVDMDAFFVEVERRDAPQLRGVPVLVGGTGNRGVVASASYEARRFGIHAAMPMGHARRLCPSAAVLPPDHRKYRAASEQVFAIFRSFTPLVEGVSLDEAFLDVSGLRLHIDHVLEVAERLRRKLRSDLGLPASVGVAANKLLAKLASQSAKPDGIRHLPAGTELDFLHPLPVRALWGIGEATHASLERLGVVTVGDLAQISPETLIGSLGRAAGRAMHELSWGRDDRPVVAHSEAKSLSVEQTYEHDVYGAERLSSELLGHCDRLADRLRRAGLMGRTVTVKIRFADFTTVTRSETLEGPILGVRDLHRVAVRVLARIAVAGRAVRLVGVGISGLSAASAPRQLAVDRPAKWDDLAEAVGRVRDRFGNDAVRPAGLTGPTAGSRPVRENDPFP